MCTKLYVSPLMSIISLMFIGRCLLNILCWLEKFYNAGHNTIFQKIWQIWLSVRIFNLWDLYKSTWLGENYYWSASLFPHVWGSLHAAHFTCSMLILFVIDEVKKGEWANHVDSRNESKIDLCVQSCNVIYLTHFFLHYRNAYFITEQLNINFFACY